MNIISQILQARKELTTYRVGLLQTKVYRALKEKTATALVPYKMTSTEWAFLGMISEYPNGVRSLVLADILGVEAPFITALVSKFKKKGIVYVIKNDEDKRVKPIALTPEGHRLAKEIESVLRNESRKWREGISPRELLTYITVLKKLNDN